MVATARATRVAPAREEIPRFARYVSISTGTEIAASIGA
jgi:hypothetical protein